MPQLITMEHTDNAGYNVNIDFDMDGHMDLEEHYDTLDQANTDLIDVVTFDSLPRINDST